jgi:hypothetical protein
MRGDYQKQLEHRDKLRAKKQRLEGLRDLYRTYEQAGQVPTPNSYMWKLRAKIHSVETQLRVMADSDGIGEMLLERLSKRKLNSKRQ